MARSLCPPASTDMNTLELDYKIQAAIDLIASSPLLILILFAVSLVVDTPWMILAYNCMPKNQTLFSCLLSFVIIITLPLCLLQILLAGLTFYYHKFVVFFILVFGNLLGMHLTDHFTRTTSTKCIQPISTSSVQKKIQPGVL